MRAAEKNRVDKLDAPHVFFDYEDQLFAIALIRSQDSRITKAVEQLREEAASHPSTMRSRELLSIAKDLEGEGDEWLTESRFSI